MLNISFQACALYRTCPSYFYTIYSKFTFLDGLLFEFRANKKNTQAQTDSDECSIGPFFKHATLTKSQLCYKAVSPTVYLKKYMGYIALILYVRPHDRLCKNVTKIINIKCQAHSANAFMTPYLAKHFL